MLTPQNLVKNLTPDASPKSVMWANFVAPIFARTEPHVRAITIDHVETLEDLVPFATIEASFTGDDIRLIEASSGEATYLLQWRPFNDHGLILIRSARVEIADKAEADVKSRRVPVPTSDESVRLDFWQVDGMGDSYTNSRVLDAPAMEEIAANYPADVWGHLDRLRGLEPQVDDGRIVLWHGPPGTGKTSAIRALARAWRDRIQVQVLLDPERILASSTMLMSVILNGEPETWRLLVIEDADELLTTDAKDRVGQSLSRLLNLSDGLLGQGSKVLVLITTNEPIGRIHPALIRPGRCLQETEFRRFTRSEAKRVATEQLPPGASFSLAELSAINDGRATDVAKEVPIGTYL